MADEKLSNIENLENTETLNPADFKILVVDDTPANVMLLRMQLTKAGYQVCTCEESPKVHDLCIQERPDLILQDVMMPVMNGYEVVTQLKQDPETASIPVIFLTAFADKEHTLAGFACGGNDYVAKPFEKDILLARVNSQLKLTAARRVIIERNESLRDTLTSRDRMYSVIAHDLRSPLGVVQMTLKALSDCMGPELIGEDFSAMLTECNKQVGELFDLLDNLLKWTKSQTGSLKVVYQDFQAELLTVMARDMFTSLAAMKKLSLQVSNADPNIMLHADNDMCQTILRNLLSNAIKFTPEGKSIYVSVHTEGDFAVVRVKDEGCGMSDEELSRLFHKDTHFSKYGTAREEGSGLGLMICSGFAKRLGGKLEVQSTEGVGSIFDVYIPLAK